MKKVTFSIKKRNNEKITGVGYITEEDLLIPAISSKTNKPYIRVFEDCIKDCHKITGRENQYQGLYDMILPCEFEKNGSYEIKELPVTYYIWFKIIAE